MAPTLPLDTFHAYSYGTGVWYATRAVARIYDPYMVYTWFSNERLDQEPSQIELYNIRTDALGLALTALLSILLPSIASGQLSLLSTRALSASTQTAQVARIALLGTVLHHAGTGLLAYAQWAEPRTSTGAMLLGWVVSGFLSLLGVAAWFGVLEGVRVGGGGRGSGTKRLRSGRKVR